MRSSNHDVEQGTYAIQPDFDQIDSEKFGVPVDTADEAIRAGFVRKVFGILSLQLLVTFAIICFFSLFEPVRLYVDVRTDEGHPWVFLVGMILSFACLITLACCANQARTHPNNLVFLSLFTLGESVVLGVVCAAYTLDSVLLAMGVTSLLVFGLMVYSFTTKRDFTGAGPYLFLALMSLLMYGFILALLPGFRTDLTRTIYSYIGVLIFSFYVVFDVQLIIGAKHHKFRFGVDEHIFASINIYLDIINLFIRFVQIFGNER